MKYIAKIAIIIFSLSSIVLAFSYFPFNAYSQTNMTNSSNSELSSSGANSSQNSSLMSSNVATMLEDDSSKEMKNPVPPKHVCQGGIC